MFSKPTKKKIRTYYVDGIAIDQDWIVQNRELLEDSMRDDMRAHGWAPVMDQPVVVTWDMMEDGKFKFRMAHKGIEVGRKKASKTYGVMSNEGIVISTNGENVELSLLLT